MAEQPVRWGFLSTARIGTRVWNAVFHSGNGVVAAVASRDRAKAEAFIAEHQKVAPFAAAPRAFGSYEEMLADPGIDAVYVPLPTGLRCEWVVAAARAGKHVACEKPTADSLENLEKMLAACEQAGVQFMDGVMFMHGPRLKHIRAVLDDGQSVGNLRRVTSQFAFHGDEKFFQKDIRVDSKLEPFGTLGDLGWYDIRVSLFAGKWELPKAVSGRILRAGRRPESPGDVPISFSGELIYDTWSAGFYCSFATAFHQWVHIEGDKGGVYWDDFVGPQKGETARYWVRRAESVTEETGDPSPQGQATWLYRNFANLVRAGKPDPFWPEISWRTQYVMEACLRSALLPNPGTLVPLERSSWKAE
ncbi:MAG TPA: Gfo/Idh/MocA family oxidoreductase [Opitutaceae bacterium]|jgi:predicted dehydrogenase